MFRSFLFSKLIILVLIIILLFAIYGLNFNNSTICDPAKHLWWFCPNPDPKTTICTWNDHYPIPEEQLRSPESYAKWFSSLPKIQKSFKYNNLTLQKCEETSLDLLIFVMSKCSHASIRHSIRRTWGNTKSLERYFPNIKVKLLFLLDVDSNSVQKIQLEHEYHQDIVQIANLPEQYEYVTKREAAMYHFVKYHCQQLKYMFKTDDDIFINTYLLLSLLNDHISVKLNETSYFLVGLPIEYGLVVRHAADRTGERYVITNEEYSCARYPTFLSGFGYLMSYKTSSIFTDAYLTDSKPFPLSDVYFTGLLSEMIQIKREVILQNIDFRYLTRCDKDFFRTEKSPFVCAASNDHFGEKNTAGDRSLMNEYNMYWTIITERYNSLKL